METNKIFEQYTNFYSALFNIATKSVYDPTKKHLGNDIYLVYYTEEDKNEFCFRLEHYKNPKSKKIFDNRDKYGYLMKDGIKLSDITFRCGGFGGTYKNGYCQLIQYTKNKTIHNHCIVDINGKIVLSELESGDKLYYIDGILATMKDYIYNLTNGKIIVKGKNIAKTKDFIFIDNNYDFRKEYKEGIYKIDIKSGEYEFYEK